MKNIRLFAILVTVLSISFSVSAMQEKFIKHTVLKGETITQISQKYKITPYDIYKLNPDSQNGIQLNSVLLIPSTAVIATETVPEKKAVKTSSTSHVAQPKETLYSISKQYNVSIEAIQNANGNALKNGLKIGQNIIIPAGNDSNTASTSTVESPKTVVTPSETKVVEKPLTVKKASGQIHIIQPKETKYSISKLYSISIDELEKLNPQIVSGFPIGLKLKLPGNANEVATINEDKPVIVQKTKVEVPKDVPTSSSTSGKKYFQEYLVKPKDTPESIASEFGITENELLKLNPELKKGIKLGMILRVPKISDSEKKKD